jgi:hypothetical protein
LGGEEEEEEEEENNTKKCRLSAPSGNAASAR